ncbi:MAG: Gfo/Idh/MocA family oxidoreductase [Pseudomonadota bacterium]
MIRLLLAGAGLIGRRHLAHIVEHPALSLAGVIDPSDEARALADAPTFARAEEVDVEADGIVVATPNKTHLPMLEHAVRRGWHALVEKPIAEDLDAADRIVEIAQTSNIEVLIGHHRRHHPRAAKMKEMIAGGTLGRPVTGSLLWMMRKPDDYFAVPWRAGMDGAPVRMNLIHDVDLLRWWLGEVVDVVGLGSNMVRGAERTESGGAVLSFVSGAIVTIAFSDATPSPWGFEAGTGENPNIATTGETAFKLAFERGAVEFPTLRVWSGSETWAEAPMARDEPVDDGVPLIRQLEHFAEVIAGRAEPLVSAREGRATLAATLRIETETLSPTDARSAGPM